MTSTFVFVTFAWVFFRANSIDDTLLILKKIITSLTTSPTQIFKLPGGKMAFIYIIPFILLDWNFRKNERKLKFPQNKIIRHLIYTITTLFIFLKIGTQNNFIYFQF